MTQKSYSFTAPEASRESILLRAALCGPTGSGKTKTGLILGSRMVERMGLGPLFVIDSETRSALRYAPSRKTPGQGYRFRHVAMPEDDFSPQAYIAAIDFCEREGAGAILIDSLSHAWNGINGTLEQVDKATEAATAARADRAGKGSTFSDGWRKLTPVQNKLIQRVLSSSAHIIVTMRAEMDYVVEGTSVRKVGLAPVQRKGVEYEFDMFFDMTTANWLTATKSRSDLIPQGFQVQHPGPELADLIVDWLEDAAPNDIERTLGEAINRAVAEGILAAEEKNPKRYTEAKDRLLAWCRARGVSSDRAAEAIAQFKERIALVAGPRAATTGPEPQPSPGDRPASPPPLANGAGKTSDEDRLRAIDQGRA